MALSRVLAAALLALAVAPACATAQPEQQTQSVPLHAGDRWAATGWPDRIVLTPAADPARGMAAAWRTTVVGAVAEAQIAIATDGPGMAHVASTITGATQSLDNENGPAAFHQVRFTNLQPNTPYVYRVRGPAGWSEWLPFRTAHAEAAPFRFIYLGDTQNDILDIGSRTLRTALRQAGEPALILHAGDLVAQREEKVHDDEWGEWNAVGGHAFATIPQVPVTGNHEYVDHILPDGEESRLLGPHWSAQFALPQNGVAPVATTTYTFDYQGVRFVVLDGTAALDLGALDAQTAWLDNVLTGNPNKWTIVSVHQPLYTCARPRDTVVLRDAWRDLLARHGVDLVLQGHDHCYSRVSDPGQGRFAATDGARRKLDGPVHVVSVAGSKMYGLNDRAQTQPDRVAEETQLYQILDVEQDAIRFRAYTAAGRLYDAFDLEKPTGQPAELVEIVTGRIAQRVCDANHKDADGIACKAEPK